MSLANNKWIPDCERSKFSSKDKHPSRDPPPRLSKNHPPPFSNQTSYPKERAPSNSQPLSGLDRMDP